MSLLIKALQKAEQSKQAATAEKAEDDALRLELAPHPEVSEQALSLAEESGFSEFHRPRNGAVSGGSSAQPATVSEPSPARETAAKVFRAKEVTDPGDRRAFWLGLGGLALLLLVGIGFYLYLDSLQQPALVVARPLPPRPQPIAQAPVPSAPPAAPMEQSIPVPASSMPEPAAPPATVPAPVAVTAEPPTTKPVEPVTEKLLVTTSTSGSKNKPSPPVAATTADAKPAIEIKRSRKSEPAIDPTALAAYQAFTAGDDAAAARLYRQLLQADPRSVDALLGLAAIAARQDKGDEAAGYYARALELDPKNTVAHAGLTALVGGSDPVAAQSRVKSLLARQPDDAYLHAVLGGLYAEQNQWNDAQQAYFQAFRLDPGNAEHAFNLAVSLDQLGKTELALDYYQRALELLTGKGGNVDRAALESRITQLRSALGR
ncbi:MAG: tetratricopeptide repeat protein [Methylophilaceae bacterium]|nr:tetratricopeptide repeat protein [Methylophilaceae bacterium]